MAPRLPTPIRSKTRAMPPNNSIRFDDRHRTANSGEQPIETNEYQPINGIKGTLLWRATPQNVDLLPQRPNLGLDRSP